MLSAATPGRATAGDEPLSRVVLHDGRGDVWGVTGFGEEDSYVPAGSQPAADVTAAVAAHGRGSVRIRMRFVDLRRVSQAYVAFIRSRDDLFLAYIEANRRNPAGRHELLDYSAASGVDCAGFAHDLEYDTDRVVVRIPRSCLDRPRWVRISLSNYRYRSEDAQFPEVTDNPHNRGGSGSGGETPRLYRI
jgi:hypothetical protein